MSEKQETPPRLWVQLFNNFVSTYEDPREVHDNGKPVHVYVPESELARARRQLGQMVMLLLQNQFDEARELALRIPLEFPNGEPSARDESEGQDE